MSEEGFNEPADRSWLDQRPYRLRLEWGPRAAQSAARRGDVIVLVDVLSFTTTVSAAIDFGATIVPFAWGRGAAAEAEATRIGAHLSVGDGTRRKLSPLGFSEAARGELYLLASPNGATCSRIAADGAAAVFAGSLRNATAVAHRAQAEAQRQDVALTIVPCGEIWPADDDTELSPQRLRPCVEDLLGAGAIAVACAAPGSPEVRMAQSAFRDASATLADTLFDCVGGRELRARGCADDVRFSAQHDVSSTVPVLRIDRYVSG